MFEVGKKYVGETGHVYDCSYVDKQFAVLTRDGYRPVICEHSSPGRWSEYIEPRKEYFNAYKSTNGKATFFEGPFNDRSEADFEAGSYRYGVLIVTHHSDTKVETEFVLTPRISK